MANPQESRKSITFFEISDTRKQHDLTSSRIIENFFIGFRDRKNGILKPFVDTQCRS